MGNNSNCRWVPRRVRVSIDHALVASLEEQLRRDPRATIRIGASVRRGGDELELIVPRLDGAEAGAPVLARIFRPAAAARRADTAFWIQYDKTLYQRPTLDLGLESDGGAIAAFLAGHERIAVHEIFLVGRQLMRLVPARGPNLEDVPLSENARFSRFAGALGGVSVLRRLQALTFACIGVGRLGSLLVVGLARAGVRRIILVDGDVLEPHSQDVEALARDVGRPKVVAVASMVHAIARDVEVVPIEANVESGAALEAVAAADVVMSASDSDLPARLVATLAAAAWARPHIDVGTGVFGAGADWVAGADVRLCLRGRCLMCLGGLDLSLRTRQNWAAQRAGSLRELNQAAVAQALLLLQRLVVGDLTHSKWMRLSVARDGALSANVMTAAPTTPCSLCGRIAGIGDGLFDLNLVRGPVD
jgi:molybdopterin/thiamine biosynthesis adenylyltransferase